MTPPVPQHNPAFIVVAVLACVLFLRYAQELFVPIVISLLIAYALNPFVVLLETCRLPRTIAAGLVVIALLAAITLASYGLRQQFEGVLDSIPASIAKIRLELQRYRQSGARVTPIGKIQQAATEIEKTAAEATAAPQAGSEPKIQVQEPAFRINDLIRTGSFGFIGLVSDAVLVLFLIFFLLASGNLFKHKIVRLVGTGMSGKRLTVETLNEINAQIERFLLIQVLTGAGVGCSVAFGLWMFGLHQPGFWGVAAGILCSIPYIGPTFVGFALMLAAFVQFDSVGAALEIALVPLIVFTLEGFLIKPAVMGRAARINGTAMFIGLLFWGWIWGIIGIIVAVPIMMVVKTVCDRVEGLQPLGILLDES